MSPPPTDHTHSHDRSWSGAITALLAAIPPLQRTMAAEPRERSRADARREIAIAVVWGLTCHAVFAAAVIAMIVAMWFGMSQSFGQVPAPWNWIANAALLAQFPLAHSLFLTRRGQRWLARLAPTGTGKTLATTTYALIASVQLFALFALWTPSGVVWWTATGWSLWLIGALYAASWGLLIKASWDAGAEVQSGLLGWASLLRGVAPKFPPMPETGLFRLVRQPIYVSFALTTWCVPTWTPDQLTVAITLTTYCLLGPLLKEQRFDRMFGPRWRAYRARHPYWVPFRLGILKRPSEDQR